MQSWFARKALLAPNRRHERRIRLLIAQTRVCGYARLRNRANGAGHGGEPAGMGNNDRAARRVCRPGGLLVCHEFSGDVIDVACHARRSGIERGHGHEPSRSLAVITGISNQ